MNSIMHLNPTQLSEGFLPSTDLVVYPNLFREISRLVDLFGSLDQYRYSTTESRADAEAIQKDYELVFNDLTRAIDNHERQAKTSAITPRSIENSNSR